jgi:hypothetical protein
MKLNIPAQLAPIDWWPLKRALFLSLTLVVAVGLIGAVATGKPRASTASAPSRRVLYIGDSLSVGKFGELLHAYLVKAYEGPKNVALYASCGSSPENWLRAEPVFVTPCGYREEAVDRYAVVDSSSHHATPKLEDLVARYRPTTLIVQLGTNWMDKLMIGKEIEVRSYLRQFIAAAHRTPVQELVWIMPPDSSHYPRRVQETVAEMLRTAAARDSTLILIDSRSMTRPYVPGKTGRDGIHYNTQSSADWALKVIARLQRKSRWATVAY